MNIGVSIVSPEAIWLAVGPSVIPPSDEKTLWLVSTCMMWLNLVIDQYLPKSESSLRWTGSSLRKRENKSQCLSCWKSAGLTGLISERSISQGFGKSRLVSSAVSLIDFSYFSPVGILILYFVVDKCPTKFIK